jgi:hypothetical protein
MCWQSLLIFSEVRIRNQKSFVNSTIENRSKTGHMRVRRKCRVLASHFLNALQAACKSSSMRMSMADDSATTSRRAALGALLGGAITVPGSYAFYSLCTHTKFYIDRSCVLTSHHAAATAFAFLEGAKGQDRNYQLKNGGVMTDVVSSSMAGTRVSGFKTAIIGSQERAKSLARPPVSGKPRSGSHLFRHSCNCCFSHGGGCSFKLPRSFRDE